MKIFFPFSNQIAKVERIEFKQGAAVKHGAPVLLPDRPWENVLAYLYGSVIKTTIYRLWYQAGGVYVAYARSRDGVSWEKPELNVFSAAELRAGPTVDGPEGGEACASGARPVSLQSNVVLDLHMPSLVYEPCDRRRPFKLFGFTDRGYCAAFSTDGIRFEPAAENPVLPLLKFPAKNNRKTWYSDVAPVFKDTRINKYVGHVKTYESDAEERIRRCVGYSESEDFVHWTEPMTIWVPGADEDRLAQKRGFQWADFYGLCGFNYGDGNLGLLWLFYIDHELERGTHRGKIEVFLVASDDGKSWRRFSDAPLIPLDDGFWDSGMITTATQPLFLDDEIRVYYGGANFDHAAGEKDNPYDDKNHRFSIGFTRLRKDGFVCATSSDGTLATTALDFHAGRIKVNADCRGGRIAIDVLQSGRAAETFILADVDAVERLLRTSVRGKAVLQINIQNAKLYSIEIE